MSGHFTRKNFSTSTNKAFLPQSQSAAITSGMLTQTRHDYIISSFSSGPKNGLSSWTSAVEMRGHSCWSFFVCLLTSCSFLHTQINVFLSTNSFDKRKINALPLELRKKKQEFFKAYL